MKPTERNIMEPVGKVDVLELQFIREHAPTAFTRLIVESLQAEGVIHIDRNKVHKELTTLKDEYNLLIIDKARQLLKDIKKVEYQANNS